MKYRNVIASAAKQSKWVFWMIVLLLFSNPLFAQLGGGSGLGGSNQQNNMGRQLQQQNRQFQESVTAALNQPPLPANCTMVDITSQCPATAVNPRGQRTICSGYFWGDAVQDFCRSDEIENQFRIIYFRSPASADSNEAFERAFIPTEANEDVFKCGNGTMSSQELNEFFRSPDTAAMHLQNLLGNILPSAFAEDLETSQRYDNARPLTAAEKSRVAAILFDTQTRLLAAIQRGEYGEAGSLTETMANDGLEEMRSTILILDRSYMSHFVGSDYVWEAEAELNRAPSIEWVDYLDEYHPGGHFHSRNNTIVLSGALQNRLNSTDSYEQRLITGVIYHELTHYFTKDFTPTTTVSELLHAADPSTMRFGALGALTQEYLADLNQHVFFCRNSAMATEDCSRKHDLFMRDPYDLMVEEGLERPDMMLTLLPRSFISDQERNFLQYELSDASASSFGLTNSTSSSSFCSDSDRPCTGRPYDWLFPNCFGNGADSTVPGCPDPNQPNRWPEEQNNKFNTALRLDLIGHTSAWRPYIVKTVADFRAQGGFIDLMTSFRVPTGDLIMAGFTAYATVYTLGLNHIPTLLTLLRGGAAAGYITQIISETLLLHPPLQQENWLQGTTRQSPHQPSGAPQDPGVGLGPQQGYNPPGTRGGFPTQLTGQQENDPNWNEPAPSSEIEVSNEVARWSPPSSNNNNDCNGSTSAFDFCWTHFRYDQRQNAGSCRQMMEYDLNSGSCHCSHHSPSSWERGSRNCSGGSPCAELRCELDILAFEASGGNQCIGNCDPPNPLGAGSGGTGSSGTGSGSGACNPPCSSGTVCRNGYCETDASQYGCAGGSCPSGAGGSNGGGGGGTRGGSSGSGSGGSGTAGSGDGGSSSSDSSDGGSSDNGAPGPDSGGNEPDCVTTEYPDECATITECCDENGECTDSTFHWMGCE